ncbi:adenosylcobyric acid synthase [Deinobacterium chartae]|uniref:Cobyric acid synthase n=1 Tax=Deinobacterium chartae TaxID=521158 RepID=A0A841I2M0_9DEIO|nr:cobyric acid synthase [Deinobacterium chartae]MBB6098292.1 adenosylcobyric acid synthase [Deinobacterium chartae]
MKAIMLMGCTSDAGKSFLAAALCRYYANLGVRVAPFKAQNMSNNAAVTPGGLEIGRAQALQARAARVPAEPRMNPVLLKPLGDTRSAVIRLGEPDLEVSALPWMQRKKALWPTVQQALHGLLAEYELVIIEGAGSPAEVNLKSSDIVNMRVALEAQADVHLIADIDRGGAFAHLLGTWACLEPHEQARLKGFVLNKFRGDPKLLLDAPKWLEQRTGVPVTAVVPMLEHRLPEEDAFRRPQAREGVRIGLIVYPGASNLEEFDPLRHAPGVSLEAVAPGDPLDAYAAVILPGSRNTVASLEYLRRTGLAARVARAARAGTPLLGICGGMQMLGRVVRDPHGLEGGDAEGLGLLDLETELAPAKTTAWREVRLEGGARVRGYEIHHGETRAGPGAMPYLEAGLGWRQGNVWGVYLHGLLEDAVFRASFLNRLGWQGEAEDWDALLEAELERAAALVTSSGWAAHLPAPEQLRSGRA